MNLHGHFQNAYVTHDLDRAMEIVRQTYEVTGTFFRIDPDMILTTPEGEKPSQVRVAIIWIGAFQLEIIQPVGGFVDHYLPYLPDDRSDASLRFHHICMRRNDLDAMQAEIDASGLPRAFEAGYPGGYFVYLDARATLGHYLEYAWATEEAWAWQGWPSDRPI